MALKHNRSTEGATPSSLHPRSYCNTGTSVLSLEPESSDAQGEQSSVSSGSTPVESGRPDNSKLAIEARTHRSDLRPATCPRTAVETRAHNTKEQGDPSKAVTAVAPKTVLQPVGLPTKPIATLATIPSEILCSIIGHLDVQTLRNFRLVSMRVSGHRGAGQADIYRQLFLLPMERSRTHLLQVANNQILGRGGVLQQSSSWPRRLTVVGVEPIPLRDLGEKIRQRSLDKKWMPAYRYTEFAEWWMNWSHIDTFPSFLDAIGLLNSITDMDCHPTMPDPPPCASSPSRLSLLDQAFACFTRPVNDRPWKVRDSFLRNSARAQWQAQRDTHLAVRAALMSTVRQAPLTMSITTQLNTALYQAPRCLHLPLNNLPHHLHLNYTGDMSKAVSMDSDLFVLTDSGIHGLANQYNELRTIKLSGTAPYQSRQLDLCHWGDSTFVPLWQHLNRFESRNAIHGPETTWWLSSHASEAHIYLNNSLWRDRALDEFSPSGSNLAGANMSGVCVVEYEDEKNRSNESGSIDEERVQVDNNYSEKYCVSDGNDNQDDEDMSDEEGDGSSTEEDKMLEEEQVDHYTRVFLIARNSAEAEMLAARYAAYCSPFVDQLKPRFMHPDTVERYFLSGGKNIFRDDSNAWADKWEI